MSRTPHRWRDRRPREPVDVLSTSLPLTLALGAANLDPVVPRSWVQHGVVWVVVAASLLVGRLTAGLVRPSTVSAGRRLEAVVAGRELTTILFTDIVGSTATAASLGDAGWRDLLDRHDALVRDQLDRFGGCEVVSTGDGFLATFDAPARGVRCALAVAVAVRELGLEVRAGLHTTEVERRGHDVAGLGVHVGARVAALANPGEVLVSRTVAELVAGAGFGFRPRGTHRLRGVPGEWTVFSAHELGGPGDDGRRTPTPRAVVTG